MNPIRSCLSSGLIAVVSAWTLVACGPSIGPVIKIGVAQPLSGSSAARGQDLVNGVKLAISEINASGYKVAGKAVQFEVVVMDDKGDKEEAKKVAQALVEQKVSAVIGHLSSDVTEVVIPIYKSGNVPQLFTSSAAELTKLGDGNAFSASSPTTCCRRVRSQATRSRRCMPTRSRSCTKTRPSARRWPRT